MGNIFNSTAYTRKALPWKTLEQLEKKKKIIYELNDDTLQYLRVLLLVARELWLILDQTLLKLPRVHTQELLGPERLE